MTISLHLLETMPDVRHAIKIKKGKILLLPPLAFFLVNFGFFASWVVTSGLCTYKKATMRGLAKVLVDTLP